MFIEDLKKIKILLVEVLAHYLIFLVLFLLFRLALLFRYYELFGNLTAWQLGRSLADGIRFDAASVTLLLFAPLIVLTSPLRFTGALTSGIGAAEGWLCSISEMYSLILC